MTMANEDVVRAFAEQAYSFNLLVKMLRERGVLQPGELLNRWTSPEFEEFLKDFRGNYFPAES